MDLEGKLTALQIVNETGMSSRPEYYSGRGAMTCDLNSNQLLRIHGLIQREYGNDAAKNFVEMVANMRDLAVSNFLTCLYHLESRNWKYTGFQSDLPAGIAVEKHADGSYNLESGMLGITEAIYSGNRNETEFIRGPFLRKVGYEAPTKEFEIDCNVKGYGKI